MKPVTDFQALADVLGCNNTTALRIGYTDGLEQGFVLSLGMRYDDTDSQNDYDLGTYIGACISTLFKEKNHE